MCSLSNLLTKTSLGRDRAAASRQMSMVAWSRPLDASTTKTAMSAAARAPTASPAKSNAPGVSRRFTLWSCHSKTASAALIEWPDSFSSGSWSQTVEPSSTRPTLVTAPARKSIASASEVFPDPGGPTRATFRMRSGENAFTANPLRRREGPEPGRQLRPTWSPDRTLPATCAPEVGTPRAPRVVGGVGPLETPLRGAMPTRRRGVLRARQFRDGLRSASTREGRRGPLRPAGREGSRGGP
ncbi:MAG: hypothetical protein MAG471_00078 [Acidimicrobiaceae bacterium]|nr:hypothetical protein [Acidimicrobiaceae bacterium]